jgi:uncharacterized protein YndB with AHSA1/START domain
MDKVIFKSAELNCSQTHAFEMFTVNDQLEKWLARKAEVEPKAGGKYELFWNPAVPEVDSTIGCKVLAIDAPNFINFEWKGARQHKDFMNAARPLTNVSVFFLPVSINQTKVLIIHTGWRDSKEWDEARSWFETAWQDTLTQLEKILNG